MKKRKLIFRIILITTLFLAFIYISYACFFFFTQRYFYFPGMYLHKNVKANPPADCEVIWLDCGGYEVETWFLRPSTSTADNPFPVIIIAHGNGQIMDSWAKRVQALSTLGIGVLLVEYPGYGRSGGNPSYESITKTFTEAYDVLIRMPDVDTRRIIAFGFSMGGAAACSLIEQRSIRAVILLSTFASLNHMVHHYWVPSFLVLDPFDNAKILKDFKGPSLILHSPDDTIIPFSQAEILAAAAQNGKLIILEGSHTHQIKDWTRFWKIYIAQFLTENNIISLKD
jgi:pimeloyl-ACP methyl ester carboxylesterase